MSDYSANNSGGYKASEPIEVPPLYDWPPRPLATLKWIFTGLLFPWGLFFIALAFAAWHYLTPSMETMSTLSPGWMLLIWLRNFVLLCLLAGGLHWWLYVRRSQGAAFKFHPQWPATDDGRFLWRDQVKDNMCWSLLSGTTIWSLFEALTLWFYASGGIAWTPVGAGAASLPFLPVMLLAVFFWSSLHFYLIHRLLHWPPLYRVAHQTHHLNANVNPWSGISMHPTEHLIYFTAFLLWWVVPVHPVVIILTGFFQGLSPAVSHCGFGVVRFGKVEIPAGDLFHQLHHRYYNVNYTVPSIPLDKVFGSWHDGTAEGLAKMMARLRAKRATERAGG